jgi:hypothetical protein
VAATARGENLTLAQSRSGPVNLDDTNERRPEFSVRGFPYDGGLALRWALVDSGTAAFPATNRYPLVALSGDEPFQFGTSVIVHIPDATRRQLRASGAPTVELLCDVRIADVAGPRPSVVPNTRTWGSKLLRLTVALS